MNHDNTPNPKSDTALREEAVLKFWKEHDIFQKTLNRDQNPMGEFVFYDGPPYATGLPHYGHLLPGTMKDVIPRYKTMRGFHVPRQWGWDCHGLPIENLIQKELDLPTKQDVMEYGLEKFNQAARESVLRYERDWQEYIPRVGRFVDMAHPYKTMDPDYMESVWAVFKNLYDKGLVYKGYKSMMVSPPLETVLSNQEVNLGGYHDITDLSATVKFKLTSGPYAGAYMLAWTTTPWTLPGNVLLAVGGDVEYQITKITAGDHAGETYIFAKQLASKVLKDAKIFPTEGTHEQIYEASYTKGSNLVGSTYEPVFPYFANHPNAFRVAAADFVTTEDGTGIVHIAPGFGQDDLELGQKEGVEPIRHVKMDGHFIPSVEEQLVAEGYDVAGWAVRNTTDHMHVDVEIVKYLAHHGKLFSKQKYVHSYPLCWRTDCPLINYATESWFVNVQKIKNNLIENNQDTNWIPGHVRDGRFGKWLEDVRDWSVSRSRFWGTPLPIWQKQNGEIVVIGSQEELRSRSNGAVTKIIFVRHGESTKNTKGITSDDIDSDPLTDTGVAQAKAAAKTIAQHKPDVIFSSPVLRARQTAEIVAREIGIEVNLDKRITEVDSGNWDGKRWDDQTIKEAREKYRTLPLAEKYHAVRGETGESWADFEKRMKGFLDEIIESYAGKTIVVFGHMPVNSFGVKILRELSNEDAEDLWGADGVVAHATPVVLYVDTKRKRELDLHRPYIDQIELVDEKGIAMKRIEDVFDVWFDSGAMPYASHHYPFEKDAFQPEKGFLKKQKRFPADFVAEGQDQTRGWFYVMMVLATAQFDQPAFKNVLVNGLVLAEDGKKMSKRLKNYPDLNYMIDSAGADALRLFLMASPAVHAEDVNFSEKAVAEVGSKVMGRLRNVVSFYKLYEQETSVRPADSPNVLDRWILARLAETARDMTAALEAYEIDRGARPIFDFVDDLSTWYIRRSRDRMKGDGEDKQFALATTKHVLIEFATLIAPYVPFVAEEVYRDIGGELESVHMETWPESGRVDAKALETMQQTRDVITELLSLRKEAKLNVRQPLASATLAISLGADYAELVKDEVNVKEVIRGESLAIDTNLTEELVAEGNARELIRAIQQMRKDTGLSPEDMIVLSIDTDEQGRALVEKFKADIAETANVQEFKFESNQGNEVKVGEMTLTVNIS